VKIATQRVTKANDAIATTGFLRGPEPTKRRGSILGCRDIPGRVNVADI